MKGTRAGPSCGFLTKEQGAHIGNRREEIDPSILKLGHDFVEFFFFFLMFNPAGDQTLQRKSKKMETLRWTAPFYLQYNTIPTRVGGETSKPRRSSLPVTPPCFFGTTKKRLWIRPAGTLGRIWGDLLCSCRDSQFRQPEIARDKPDRVELHRGFFDILASCINLI